MLSEKTLTCPWWFLFTFDNPIRSIFQNPHKILSPLVKPGDKVLDVGCGMGYFSLELARLVGEQGKVIAADLQPEMLAGLKKRAARAKLTPRIQPLLCEKDKIGISETIDFANAFWMVHEVRQRAAFLQEIYSVLKPGGMLLVVEPRIHVSKNNFLRTVDLGLQIGFADIAYPRVSISRSVVLLK